MARELTRREKLAIVRKHYHEGKKQNTIARELTCSQQEVGRVLHQFVTTGDVESHWRSGRPSVVTDDVKEVIEKTIKRKRTATAEEIANAVEEETGRRVSARTMRRVRRRLHYYPVHVSAKPALTDAHKAARLAWCREHVRDSVKSLVFMDEMGVWIDYHKQVYWIKPGESRPIKELDSVKARLNVWGAIWYNGKSSLHVTRDNFNTTKYVEVLEAELAPELPLGHHRFIQDGVPFHWTLPVSNWFADHRVRLIEDFPAKSPDLNAIEYVWGWMKRSIATHEPHDYDTLEAAIFSAWEDLTQITIRHFIDHITTVMKEIIAADGGHSH
jgi:transposase